MNDTHNYFWGGWPEMPWKKEEEEEKDLSNYVYSDGRKCYDCKFSHTIEEHDDLFKED